MVFETPIPHLTLYAFTGPTPPTDYMLEPSVCLILQGRKRVVLGTETHVYSAGDFFLTSTDLPLMAEILQATPAKPYTALRLQLDRPLLARLMLEQPRRAPHGANQSPGIAPQQLSQPLLDAFRRLVGLLDETENIAALEPLIQQEIYLRFLNSTAGTQLSQFATAGGYAQRIDRAINWIKGNLNSRLRMETLAKHAGMSTSTLHRQFRALTAMSPLQYQKRLRLNEARRLMITRQIDVATAAFQVGYESTSQFTREYTRLFGQPPRRDIRQLLAANPVRP